MSDKACTKCGVIKQLSEFYRNKNSIDGRKTQCADCTRLYNKKHRIDNAEYYKNYHRQYVIDNNEKVLSYRKKWVMDNRDKVNAVARKSYYARYDAVKAYRVKNKDKIAIAVNRWKRAHPEVSSMYCAKRRLAKSDRTPLWANDELDTLIKKEAYKKAAEMTKSTGIAHEVDHIIPLSGVIVSGLHIWNNLQVITKSENARKKNKFTSSEVFA